MFAKITTALALIVSLLFGAELLPKAAPLVKSDAPSCFGMACLKGCCTSKACCTGAGQQDSRPSPSPSVPRPEFQVAVLDFRLFTFLYAVVTKRQDFIDVDEKSGRHALPPLVVSCIQLI